MATPQEPQQKGLNLEHKCYAIHKINQCHDFTQLRNELSAFFDLDLDLSKLINFLRKANRNNGALFNRLEEMAESESGFSKSVWFIERPVTQMRPTFVLGSADTRVEVRAFLVVNAPQSANGSVQQLTAHYNQTFPGEPYTSAQISIRLSKALSEGNVATQLKQFAARYSWYPVGLQAGSVPRPRTNVSHFSESSSLQNALPGVLGQVTPDLTQENNADSKMCQVEVKEEAKVRRKKSRATFEAMKDSEAALVWQQKLMG